MTGVFAFLQHLKRALTRRIDLGQVESDLLHEPLEGFALQPLAESLLLSQVTCEEKWAPLIMDTSSDLARAPIC